MFRENRACTAVAAFVTRAVASVSPVAVSLPAVEWRRFDFSAESQPSLRFAHR